MKIDNQYKMKDTLLQNLESNNVLGQFNKNPYS